MGQFSMEISGHAGSVLSGNQQADATKRVSGADQSTEAAPAGRPRRSRGNVAQKVTVADVAGAIVKDPPRRDVKRAVAGRRRSKPRPPDFEAEIAEVEAEIGALSRQLAEKLRQQNAQLRKMLERFGGV